MKILDFGIAKVGAESKITRAGSVFGTPHYMSPEQAAGTSSVDLRTDVYALGIILYELASGRVPFDAEHYMGILTQHMYKAPVPILATVPPPEGVPPGLDAIIQKCLSKKPEQRYPTMNALSEDLEKVQQGLVPDAVPEMMARSGGFNVPADYFRTGGGAGMPAPVPGTPLTGPRRRWGVYAGVSGVAAVVGVALFALLKSGPSSATTKPALVADVPAVAVPSASREREPGFRRECERGSSSGLECRPGSGRSAHRGRPLRREGDSRRARRRRATDLHSGEAGRECGAARHTGWSSRLRPSRWTARSRGCS